MTLSTRHWKEPSAFAPHPDDFLRLSWDVPLWFASGLAHQVVVFSAASITGMLAATPHNLLIPVSFYVVERPTWRRKEEAIGNQTVELARAQAANEGQRSRASR